VENSGGIAQLGPEVGNTAAGKLAGMFARVPLIEELASEPGK
jgi:hypothetical protein